MTRALTSLKRVLHRGNSRGESVLARPTLPADARARLRSPDGPQLQLEQKFILPRGE